MGDLDLTAGVWTKPASLQQRALHRVPLSAPARQLLVELEAERGVGVRFWRPSRRASSLS